MRKRLKSWTIEHCAKRQERCELAELKGFEEQFGIPLETVITQLHAALAKKRTGPPPSLENASFTADTKAARALRVAGFKIQSNHVRRVRELLAKHQPDQLPAALRLTNPLAAGVVVPFTKPSQANDDA